ncbi:invasion associated locus B family protein [Maritalea sp.]|uniref:invasion associated locus B family protein n=1 Tax=Maritalea sp. TaxID=2003361 RepID=UPI003F4AB67D
MRSMLASQKVTLLKLTIATVATMLFGSVALGQSVQSLGSFKAWSAYSTTQSSTAICFIHAKPVSVEPELAEIDQPYFYVTHRPNQGVSHEMNLVAGFEFGTDSLASVKIGGEAFSMFTQGDAAWLEDVSLSNEMASAMRRGTTMVFEGINKQGVRVALTFSLSGATASMRKIDAACNR